MSPPVLPVRLEPSPPVDVAALAAVAAVGAAARDELLAAEAQGALAAVAGGYMDFDFVYKHKKRL